MLQYDRFDQEIQISTVLIHIKCTFSGFTLWRCCCIKRGIDRKSHFLQPHWSMHGCQWIAFEVAQTNITHTAQTLLWQFYLWQKITHKSFTGKFGSGLIFTWNVYETHWRHDFRMKSLWDPMKKLRFSKNDFQMKCLWDPMKTWASRRLAPAMWSPPFQAAFVCFANIFWVNRVVRSKKNVKRRHRRTLKIMREKWWGRKKSHWASRPRDGFIEVLSEKGK